LKLERVMATNLQIVFLLLKHLNKIYMNKSSSQGRVVVEIVVTGEVVVVAKIGEIVKVVASIVLKEMVSSKRRVVRGLEVVVLATKYLLGVLTIS